MLNSLAEMAAGAFNDSSGAKVSSASPDPRAIDGAHGGWPTARGAAQAP